MKDPVLDMMTQCSLGECVPPEAFSNTLLEILTKRYPDLVDVWITMIKVMPSIDTLVTKPAAETTKDSLIEFMASRLKETPIGNKH